MSDISGGKKEKKPRVCLEKDTIHFPTVTMKNGTSVAKVTIKNKTHKPVKFQIEPLEAPFENNHTEVEVKPHFYLSVPVLFRPSYNMQKSTVPLVLKNSQQILTVELVGVCHYIIDETTDGSTLTQSKVDRNQS